MARRSGPRRSTRDRNGSFVNLAASNEFPFSRDVQYWMYRQSRNDPGRSRLPEWRHREVSTIPPVPAGPVNRTTA